jgi:hypothetical protein
MSDYAYGFNSEIFSVSMRFSQTIKRFLSFGEVPWPLRIVRGVLAFYLVFGLAAAVAWLGFGRNAEKQVGGRRRGVDHHCSNIFCSLTSVRFNCCASSSVDWTEVRRFDICART